MSLESAKAFLQDVNSGKTILDAEKLAAADPASRLAYAHSFGYDFTKDELREVAIEGGHPITMEETESIVGGMRNDGPGCPTNAGQTATDAADASATSPLLTAMIVAPMILG